MKIVVLGATKGIGRALARRCAERGDRLFLLGRDLEDLERSARDLEIRGAEGVVGVGACDLTHPQHFATALGHANRALAGFDCIVVTAGQFAKQDELENDASLVEQLLTIDFTNTILFCEEARRQLISAGGGTLCVFSSVAGERGRKPVILYGAAKAGLTHYLEGLDHKFRASGLKVVCVLPGFINTGMTLGLKPPPFAGEPSSVAREVLRAIDRGLPQVFVPGIWRWVSLVIRLLPRWIMRRIAF